MSRALFHIFRNSPLGRENLLQSIYFCQKLRNLPITVFQPTATQCAMYFDSDVVTIDLDSTYTQYEETSCKRIEELVAASGLNWEVYAPTDFTAGTIPNLPPNWTIMACPRAISEKASRIGLGHIGPKVRAIVKHTSFPVFIPCLCFKPWNSVTGFFGGSELGLRAVRIALSIAEQADLPLKLFTQFQGANRAECEKRLSEANLSDTFTVDDVPWEFFDSGSIQENLYTVPYDSLVVVGAAGHSLMHEFVFGSNLELIQSTLANPIVVVGPSCRETLSTE